MVYLDGSEFGLTRPGLQVTPFASGRFLTRDWSGRNRVEYDLTPALFNATDDTLAEWNAYWHHIDGGALAGYIVDPISDTHRDLLCGGIADGTQTTFPIPVIAPASVTALVDGAPYHSSSYTIHAAANWLPDGHASGVHSAGWVITNGSGVARVAVSCDGLNCLQVTPDGGGVPQVKPDTNVSGISVGDSYTSIVACLPRVTDSYQAVLHWYTSGDVYIDSELGGYTSLPSGVWTTLTVTGTAPATTAKALPGIYREDLGTEFFFVDCLALIPGDYTRWHLPSVSPGLVEFDAAPASGARVTATATGKRVTRCRFEPGTRWSMRSPGHASVRSVRAVEWPEF